jgi:hypothetical protein
MPLSPIYTQIQHPDAYQAIPCINFCCIRTTQFPPTRPRLHVTAAVSQLRQLPVGQVGMIARHKPINKQSPCQLMPCGASCWCCCHALLLNPKSTTCHICLPT